MEIKNIRGEGWRTKTKIRRSWICPCLCFKWKAKDGANVFTECEIKHKESGIFDSFQNSKQRVIKNIKRISEDYWQ